jgi:histidinol dehydrogenase
MASVNLQRIDGTGPEAASQLAQLRQRIGAQAEVVSPRSRQLTEEVFGEALSPARVVERICQEVRQRGLEAVLHYTERLDRVRLTPQDVRISAAELAQAHAAADRAFLETVRRVRQNVFSFQAGILVSDATLTMAGKHELKLRYRPMKRVGVCVPGGAASYPSTLLMTVGPAQAAGVKEIAVVLPPTPSGAGNRDLLAVCKELGVNEVYRIGGAQAVAALAYGVAGISPVDMIVGPGNIFVTLAKRYVFGQVAIDCLAGPSEVVVVADDTARADYVAADLIAQAEHSPGVSLLVSWHEPLLDAVAEAIERQLAELSRAELCRDSLERFGALIRVRDSRQAIALVNDLAPEHLHIQTREPHHLAEQIDHAGAIFLGPDSPVALGDYVAGPSHVLPTGGSARFASGLSANDFLRRSSVLTFHRAGLEALAHDLQLLAAKEGLTGHAASVAVRLRPAAAAGPSGNEPEVRERAHVATY